MYTLKRYISLFIAPPPPNLLYLPLAVYQGAKILLTGRQDIAYRAQRRCQ